MRNSDRTFPAPLTPAAQTDDPKLALAIGWPAIRTRDLMRRAAADAATVLLRGEAGAGLTDKMGVAMPATA